MIWLTLTKLLRVTGTPLSVKAPPVKRAYSWTACYVGIHAGWGFGDVSVDNGANVLGRVLGTPASENVHPKGPEFGGTIAAPIAAKVITAYLGQGVAK